MASTTQDRIYETFVAISGARDSVPDSMTEASQELAKSVDSAAKAIESTGQPATWSAAQVLPGLTGTTTAVNTAAAQTADTSTNTTETIASTALNSVLGAVPLAGLIFNGQGATSSGSAGTSGGGGVGNTLESIATTVLKSGFGVVPLIGELFGLFGGGSTPAAPELVKYAMPASINFQGAETSSGLSNADYDQFGSPRAYGGSGGGAQSSPGSSTNAGGTGMGSGPAPQITVNVQAMDARSFLDRSSDIAAAVRDAMLNLNSINDVVNDL